MALSIMTLSIMTLNIMELSEMTFSITYLCKATPSIITVRLNSTLIKTFM
jgi:hypothetical protein